MQQLQLHGVLSTKSCFCVHLSHCFYCHSTCQLGYKWNKEWVHQEPLPVASNTGMKQGCFTKRAALFVTASGWQCTLLVRLLLSDRLWATCHHIVHLLAKPDLCCHLRQESHSLLVLGKLLITVVTEITSRRGAPWQRLFSLVFSMQFEGKWEENKKPERW